MQTIFQAKLKSTPPAKHTTKFSKMSNRLVECYDQKLIAKCRQIFLSLEMTTANTAKDRTIVRDA